MKYTSIVFSAYVVPTIPALTGAVGDPDGAGFVTGKYVGVDGDPKDDVAARFKLVAAAANQAYGLATETRDDESVLHIFVIPEFFFRGPNGAYESPSKDHGLHDELMRLVREFADQPKFSHWMFVCGTILETDAAYAETSKQKNGKLRDDVISAITRAYHGTDNDETREFTFDLLVKATEFAQKHPLHKIHNRCYIYKQNSTEYPEGLFIEKRYVSHEDFVVSVYSPNAYSEASVAYPYIDESDGELKKSAFDSKSLFTLDGISFATEICLDHRRGRLREVRKSHEPSQVPVDVHLVVSCGMQLQQPSVVAKTGGLVFNTDGQYAKRDVKASPDDKDSIFTASADGKGHTQMCVVAKEADIDTGADAQLQQPMNVKVTTAPLDAPSGVQIDQVEAYGAGEVHVYSKCSLP